MNQKTEEYINQNIQVISSLTHRFWPVLAVITFAICGFGCTPKPVNPMDYGIAYNHVRDSLGIKQIPIGWVADAHSDGRIFYTNPNIDSTNQNSKVYYAGKILEIKNDSLMYEEDDYVVVRFTSSKQWIPIEGLSILYFYYPNEYNCIGWVYYHLINEHPQSDTLFPSPVGPTFKFKDGRLKDSNGNPIEMTRADVDSILATWGMKYP